MMSKMGLTFKISLLLISTLVYPLTASSSGFLRVKQHTIVDESGKEFLLRGMGLGGWMLQEGYMLRMPGGGSQQQIKAKITDLIGAELCEKFYEKWLSNHVTKTDIDSLAKWGFNSVRLPMHYNLFTLPIELETHPNENTWLSKGFELTDSLVSWCKANNMYVILDLHAAPGGQGKDANISDYDSTKPSLWESDLNKKKTIALWARIAEHYKDEPNIGGYDLLNEPNWTFENKDIHGREDLLNKDIWDLYIEISKAIRKVDKKHILFIEGNGWANNFNGLPGKWDDNMVLSFHKYWNPNTQQSIGPFLKLRKKYDIPLWLGESGENSNKWFTDCIRLVEKNHIGWSWWPLKKVSSVVNPLTISAPVGYDQLLKYWEGGNLKPSKDFAAEVLFKLTDNLKTENCAFNEGVIDAMFRQRFETNTLPYTNNFIPGKIYGVNYDLGYYKKAYFDSDNENIMVEGKRTFGNRGNMFRNDGVDIKNSDNQQNKFNNRFHVFSINAGEWLKFTVNINKSGKYQLLARIKSNAPTVKFNVFLGRKAKKIEFIQHSKNANYWQTIDCGVIELEKGESQLRIEFASNDVEFDFLEFIEK
jgi:endoglucanase